MLSKPNNSNSANKYVNSIHTLRVQSHFRNHTESILDPMLEDCANLCPKPVQYLYPTEASPKMRRTIGKDFVKSPQVPSASRSLVP